MKQNKCTQVGIKFRLHWRQVLGVFLLYLVPINFCFALNDAVTQKVNKTLLTVFSQQSSGGFATGTGFFVDENGGFITNYHVVRDASAVIVVHNGTKTQYATANANNIEHIFRSVNIGAIEVVDVDPLHDIAFLRLLDFSVSNNYDFLSLATRTPNIFEELYCLSFPKNITKMGTTTQLGSIAKINRVIAGLSDARSLYPNSDYEVYITAAFITDGSSGAPVFDQNGDVLAVATGSTDDSRFANFLVPAEHINTLLNENRQSSNGAIAALYTEDESYELLSSNRYLNDGYYQVHKNLMSFVGQQQVRLVGQVVDGFSSPLEQAAVTLTVFDEAGELGISYETFTDDTGTYQFSIPEQKVAQAEINIQKARYKTLTKAVTLDRTQNTLGESIVELEDKWFKDSVWFYVVPTVIDFSDRMSNFTIVGEEFNGGRRVGKSLDWRICEAAEHCRRFFRLPDWVQLFRKQGIADYLGDEVLIEYIGEDDRLEEYMGAKTPIYFAAQVGEQLRYANAYISANTIVVSGFVHLKGGVPSGENIKMNMTSLNEDQTELQFDVPVRVNPEDGYFQVNIPKAYEGMELRLELDSNFYELLNPQQTITAQNQELAQLIELKVK